MGAARRMCLTEMRSKALGYGANLIVEECCLCYVYLRDRRRDKDALIKLQRASSTALLGFAASFSLSWRSGRVSGRWPSRAGGPSWAGLPATSRGSSSSNSDPGAAAGVRGRAGRMWPVRAVASGCLEAPRGSAASFGAPCPGTQTSRGRPALLVSYPKTYATAGAVAPVVGTPLRIGRVGMRIMWRAHASATRHSGWHTGQQRYKHSA